MPIITSLLTTLFISLSTASVSNLSLLKKSCINTDCSATRITISHPPVNLIDYKLIAEFNAFLTSLQHQNTTKTVVFSSDVPGFFGDHFDLDLFLPQTTPPGVNVTAVNNQYFENLDLFAELAVIFIAEVNGRVWGGGNENIMHMDMRFAGPEALFGAPEAAGGVIHQGGIQQLVQLIGPGLTTEYILSSAQVNGTEAARIGWVNSAYSSASALRQHVDDLAKRIALFDFEVIKEHKKSIGRQAPSRKYVDADRAAFNRLATLPATQAKIAKIIGGSNNQTIPFENNLNDDIVKLLYR